MEHIRFGIIGIGNMGSAHAVNLKKGEIPGAELTAVSDINPDRFDYMFYYQADIKLPVRII